MFDIKVIANGVHQLVLQHVSMAQTGEYRSLSRTSAQTFDKKNRCQVTLDTPPFRFLSASSRLTVMVLPERLPVISGLPSNPGRQVM